LVAFSVVKCAGAAYLVYLGMRRLLERRLPAEVVTRDQPLARLFWRGAVVNVLNPKTALFFFAFLPQFVDPDKTVWSQVVVFGLAFVLLGFCSDGLYAFTAGTFGRWLRPGLRADDAVGGQPLALLERLDGRLGVGAEDAVDGHVVVPGAQELLEGSHGEDLVAAFDERPRKNRSGHAGLLSTGAVLCAAGASPRTSI
jgi:LysE type translocator